MWAGVNADLELTHLFRIRRSKTDPPGCLITLEESWCYHDSPCRLSGLSLVPQPAALSTDLHDEGRSELKEHPFQSTLWIMATVIREEQHEGLGADLVSLAQVAIPTSYSDGMWIATSTLRCRGWSYRH